MSGNKVEINVQANVTGEADVGKLGAGLGKLGTNATDAGKGAVGAAAGVDRLGAAADRAVASTNKTRQGLESISTQLAATQRSLKELGGQLAAGFSFQQFVQAAAQMEQLQAGLQAVAGDAGLAKEQMDFVRQVATRAGVDVTAAGSAFLGLAAATKGTAVEGEPTRKVFEAVSTAMAKAGKSSAETQNALVALSQIASKGTVSMEELRGQLGEALPGALQAAANGLGITTQDLIKLVENGQVAAEDLFPALTKGLNDLYGSAPAAQTLSQEITNIKNAFVEMAGNIGEAGALDALKVGAETAQTAITLLGDTLIQTGQYIGTLAAAVATADFSGFSAALEKIETDSRDRLLKAAAHNTVLRDALKLSSDQATQTAIYVSEMGAATEKAGVQAAAAAPGYTALGSAYQKIKDDLKGQLELAEKELEATKARGAAAVAQAKLLGDEAALRAAVAKAASDEAAAATDVADKKQLEVNVLRAELANKQALLAQAGPVSEQKAKELKALEDLIAVRQLDADKATAQAAAAQANAKANSAEVQAAQALTQATEALKVTRVADAQVVLSGLQVQLQVARQAEEMARLMGNEAGARKAKIAQLEIEIKITQAKADVMRIEAEGTIAVAQAKLAELKASGQVTALKEAEINASIKLAQAKVAEAKAMGQSTDVLQKMIDGLRNGTGYMQGFGNATGAAAGKQDQFAGAADRATAALERQNAVRERSIAAKEKENDLAERALSLENKRRNVDKEGFSLDSGGQRLSASQQTEESIFNALKSQGLDEATAQKQAPALFEKYKLWAKGTASGISTFSGGATAPEWLSKPFEQQIYEAAKATRSGAGEIGGMPTGGPAKTYNVQIGGRTIKTTSDADAQALIASLKDAKLSA